MCTVLDPGLVVLSGETGLAGGGNKTRKLEFLAAAAQAAGADTLITGGAPQSNHCRQTAAAAAVFAAGIGGRRSGPESGGPVLPTDPGAGTF